MQLESSLNKFALEAVAEAIRQKRMLEVSYNGERMRLSRSSGNLLADIAGLPSAKLGGGFAIRLAQFR